MPVLKKKTDERYKNSKAPQDFESYQYQNKK